MESVRKQPRNTSIELLRFAFMFLIVLLHVYAHGTEHDYQQIYDWGKNMDTAFHLSLFSIGKIGGDRIYVYLRLLWNTYQLPQSYRFDIDNFVLSFSIIPSWARF